jgi:hypothetical protein
MKVAREMNNMSLAGRTVASAFRIALIAAISLGGGAVLGQDASRTVERTYKLDERGDAQIEFDFQLDASQWAQWKDQYGDHPDMMLRNVKYQLAAAVIDDFALEKDDVHRRAVAKIKARCLANYHGNGQFALQIPKDMKLVAGSGTDWAFTSSSLENGGIVNITDRAKLPANAQNVHLTTGNDYDQLVYTVEVSPSKPKALLVLGLLFLFAAAGLGALSFLIKEKRATPPPLPT